MIVDARGVNISTQKERRKTTRQSKKRGRGSSTQKRRSGTAAAPNKRRGRQQWSGKQRPAKQGGRMGERGKKTPPRGCVHPSFCWVVLRSSPPPFGWCCRSPSPFFGVVPLSHLALLGGAVFTTFSFVQMSLGCAAFFLLPVLGCCCFRSSAFYVFVYGEHHNNKTQ